MSAFGTSQNLSCQMQGIPTSCDRVFRAIARGEGGGTITSTGNPIAELLNLGINVNQSSSRAVAKVHMTTRDGAPFAMIELLRVAENGSGLTALEWETGFELFNIDMVSISYTGGGGSQPQNPIPQVRRITETVKVPLLNLKKLLVDTLAYGDCEDFLARLIAKAGELSGGKNDPVSTDMMTIYGMLNRQARGGIRLNHEGSYQNYWNGYVDLGPIAGGGGLADGYWTQQNRSIWIHQQEIPAKTSAWNRARVPFEYAQRVIHELFHVAGKNGLYYHPIMEASAQALERLSFEDAVQKHCIPPEMW